MAINPAQLERRTGEEGFSFGPQIVTLSLGWQAYASTVDTVVDSGVVSVQVPQIKDLNAASVKLRERTERLFGYVVERHTAIPAIGNASPFDADLIVDGWWDGDGEIVHPLCGAIPGAPANIVQKVNLILANRLPPPAWAWSESIAAGKLRVRCVAVAGADHYNVYNGDTLVDTVPSAAWTELAVPAGFYQVRIAPVSGGGTVGTPWRPIPVTVE